MPLALSCQVSLRPCLRILCYGLSLLVLSAVSPQAAVFDECGISLSFTPPWRIDSPPHEESTGPHLSLEYSSKKRDMPAGSATVSVHDLNDHTDRVLLRQVASILNCGLEKPRYVLNNVPMHSSDRQDMMQHFLRTFAEGPVCDDTQRHFIGSVPALFHITQNENAENGTIAFNFLCFYLLNTDKIACIEGQGTGSKHDVDALQASLRSVDFHGEKWQAKSPGHLQTNLYSLDVPAQWHLQSAYAGVDVTCLLSHAHKDGRDATLMVLVPETYTAPAKDLKRFLASGNQSYIDEMFQRGNQIKELTTDKKKKTSLNGLPATVTTAWLKLDTTEKVFMTIYELRLAGKNVVILAAHTKDAHTDTKTALTGIIESFRKAL